MATKSNKRPASSDSDETAMSFEDLDTATATEQSEVDADEQDENVNPVVRRRHQGKHTSRSQDSQHDLLGSQPTFSLSQSTQRGANKRARVTNGHDSSKHAAVSTAAESNDPTSPVYWSTRLPKLTSQQLQQYLQQYSQSAVADVDGPKAMMALLQAVCQNHHLVDGTLLSHKSKKRARSSSEDEDATENEADAAMPPPSSTQRSSSKQPYDQLIAVFDTFISFVNHHTISSDYYINDILRTISAHLECLPNRSIVYLISKLVSSASIKEGRGDSLQLLSKALAVACSVPTVDCSDITAASQMMPSQHYHTAIIKNLLAEQRWHPQTIVNVLKVVDDLQLSDQSIHQTLVRVSRKYLTSIDVNDLPAIVEHLLVICKRGHRNTLISLIVQHMELLHTVAQQQQPLRPGGPKLQTAVVQSIESLILMQLAQWVRADQMMGETLCYMVKHNTYSYTPFSIAILLSASTTQRLHKRIVEGLLKAVHDYLDELIQSHNGVWLQQQLQQITTLKQQTSNVWSTLITLARSCSSSNSAQQSLPQLVTLALQLLDTKIGHNSINASSLLRPLKPSLHLSAELNCVRLGAQLLDIIFCNARMTHGEIWTQLTDRIIATATGGFAAYDGNDKSDSIESLTIDLTVQPTHHHSSSHQSDVPAIQLLSHLAPRTATQQYAAVKPALSNLLDHISYIAPAANAVTLLKSLQHLLSDDRIGLKDSVSILLRKSLQQPETSARIIAVHGVLAQALSTPSAHSTSMLQSQYTHSSSQMPIAPTIEPDEQTFDDTIQQLRRSLTLEPAVRQHTYIGLLQFVQYPTQCEAVLELLMTHLQRYLEPGEHMLNPFIMNRVLDYRSNEVIEPLPMLLTAIVRVLLVISTSDELEHLRQSDVYTTAEAAIVAITHKLSKASTDILGINKQDSGQDVPPMHNMQIDIFNGVVQATVEFLTRRYITYNTEQRTVHADAHPVLGSVYLVLTHLLTLQANIMTCVRASSASSKSKSSPKKKPKGSPRKKAKKAKGKMLVDDEEELAADGDTLQATSRAGHKQSKAAAPVDASSKPKIRTYKPKYSHLLSAEAILLLMQLATIGGDQQSKAQLQQIYGQDSKRVMMAVRGNESHQRFVLGETFHYLQQLQIRSDDTSAAIGQALCTGLAPHLSTHVEFLERQAGQQTAGTEQKTIQSLSTIVLHIIEQCINLAHKAGSSELHDMLQLLMPTADVDEVDAQMTQHPTDDRTLTLISCYMRYLQRMYERLTGSANTSSKEVELLLKMLAAAAKLLAETTTPQSRRLCGAHYDWAAEVCKNTSNLTHVASITMLTKYTLLSEGVADTDPAVDTTLSQFAQDVCLLLGHNDLNNHRTSIEPHDSQVFAIVTNETWFVFVQLVVESINTALKEAEYLWSLLKQWMTTLMAMKEDESEIVSSVPVLVDATSSAQQQQTTAHQQLNKSILAGRTAIYNHLNKLFKPISVLADTCLFDHKRHRPADDTTKLFTTVYKFLTQIVRTTVKEYVALEKPLPRIFTQLLELFVQHVDGKMHPFMLDQFNYDIEPHVLRMKQRIIKQKKRKVTSVDDLSDSDEASGSENEGKTSGKSVVLTPAALKRAGLLRANLQHAIAQFDSSVQSITKHFKTVHVASKLALRKSFGISTKKQAKQRVVAAAEDDDNGDNSQQPVVKLSDSAKKRARHGQAEDDGEE